MAENLEHLVGRTVRKNFLVQDREMREHKLQPFTGRVLSLRWLQSGPEFKVRYCGVSASVGHSITGISATRRAS